MQHMPPPPPPAHPDYYRDVDGALRWWDGQQWTEVATGEPQRPQQSPPAQQPAKKPDKAKIILLSIGGVIVGLVFLGSCINLLTSGDSTTAAPAPTVTVTATATQTTTENVTEKPKAPEPTKAPEPKPKPEPKAATISAREWAKIVKNPDAYADRRIIIYGEVTQFDAATGTDHFLASAAHRNTTEYGYFEGENTWMNGREQDLDNLVEGDIFKASVTVLGSYSYDTQIGGNTTVPSMMVNSIKVVS